MLELIALILFVVVPWIIGLATGSWWALLLPVASLVASVVVLVLYPPRQHSDPPDVFGILWVLGSIVAIVVCAVAILLRRRRPVTT
jgi:hypothetical protein